MNGTEAIAPILAGNTASTSGISPSLSAGMPVMAPATAPAAGDGSFLAAVTAGLDKVQADSTRAGEAITALATGADIPAHDVMLALEQARQSLLLATEVRQRLVDAYKEITGMQV